MIIRLMQSFRLATVWVTFYPMVMIATLYVDLFPRLFTSSIFSVLIVLFVNPLFINSSFIKGFSDRLNLAIFENTFIGTYAISDSKRQSQLRVNLINHLGNFEY